MFSWFFPSFGPSYKRCWFFFSENTCINWYACLHDFTHWFQCIWLFWRICFALAESSVWIPSGWIEVIQSNSKSYSLKWILTIISFINPYCYTKDDIILLTMSILHSFFVQRERKLEISFKIWARHSISQMVEMWCSTSVLTCIKSLCRIISTSNYFNYIWYHVLMIFSAY